MAQTHEVERLRRFLLDGGPGFAPDPQAIGHVVEDRHVRPDGVALEHHAQVSLLGRQKDLVRHGGDVVALDLDVAAVGMLEAGDAPERRGFAASRRPQQGDELTLFDGEVDSRHGHFGPE